ncbi:epidermal growth factor-like protein 8 [Carettochelys insculpta]|uniref:epidermal growth factor-like protein 8 n=1 Tax=Carettochelys insculpta TaxID=44489 RepID=UPI003EBA932C
MAGGLPTLVVLLCGGLLGAGGQGAKPESRGVCARHTVRVPLVHNETFARALHQPYLTLCPGGRVCSTYRTTYQVAVRQVSREVLQSDTICCRGWRKRRAGASTCEEAVCHPPCRNGGICASPGRCRCPPGWGGRYCHLDADVHRSPAPLCPQRCPHPPGSYRCEPAGPPPPSPAPSPGTRGSRTPGFAGRGRGGLRDPPEERLSRQVRELQQHVEKLEERMEDALGTLRRLLPPALAELGPAEAAELWSRLRYLDRVDALGDQVLLLEERLGACACRDGTNGFGYEVTR